MAQGRATVAVASIDGKGYKNKWVLPTHRSRTICKDPNEQHVNAMLETWPKTTP